MADMFLTKEEIATLTGRKKRQLQIEQLRKMGIPFWINAVNTPIVARAVIEGRKENAEPPKKPWVPNVLKGEG